MIIDEVINKVLLLSTIGIGTILVIEPISYFIKLFIKSMVGELIVGLLFLGIGFYISKNFNELKYLNK